jgi:uncharacterized protein with PQ loop repeat
MDFLIVNSGWVGVILGVTVPWFQIMKSIRCKTSNGVSPWTYMVLVFALFFYTVHAININDFPFIASNAFGLISNLIALILIIKYKDNGRQVVKSL